MDVAKRDRTIDDFSGMFVGGPDDLPGFHAAARQKRRAYAWPMIAPGVFIDRGSAPELAPHDDRYIFIEPALVQVLNQRGNGVVEQREFRSPCPKLLPCQSQRLKLSETTRAPASTKRRATSRFSVTRGAPSLRYAATPWP